MESAHPNPVRDAIQRLYDQGPQREWERMDRHRTEFAITLRALEKHLPPPPARLLDCGGGPGRYAIELARRGYEVTLFDLSPACLQWAKEKADQAGVTLAAYEQGSATDLSRFADETFDAVLLMGPLYHLLEETERARALSEAYRVLKPGAPLFAAFITRYAPLRYMAAHEPEWPLENPKLLERILSTGCLPPREAEETTFVAHFVHPNEVMPFCCGAGFEVLTVLGVEGVASMIEDKVNDLSGVAWETWVELNARVAPDPSVHGAVEHLLAIARKPRWRVVLRQIARRLEEAGIPYKVVGGTVAALHRVPVAVNDLDIETSADDAYHLQDFFSDQVIQAVALCESEVYRSHFGRFDFAGVEVEVMGDLHRREGDQWVPTTTQTETVVDLDGTAVRVPWLEEEVLAYIRRGRLERAALCLPHCDPGRLSALLRGHRRTNVL